MVDERSWSYKEGVGQLQLEHVQALEGCGEVGGYGGDCGGTMVLART